ncbi:MAG: AraC family transcriptional regulator [Treponema sp.]|nr:AraC family transcriptional regulator [Treponema sp.]MBR4630639.1 AraC family transcriptional regulator [Treponema sp.]MBR6914363.1 AraC family transcriptional regulator [Treponema sp.]
MDWLTSIRVAIGYMESHLEDDICAQDVADEVMMSSFFFQKGFSLLTGFGVGEYIRNRRLYKAAIDLQKSDDKIIDIAFRYRYETPESFAKAFSRFHGVSPSQVRQGVPAKTFLPLKIEISIHGGNSMDCKIKTMYQLKVIGFERIFDSENSYQEIPKFWNEFFEKYSGDSLPDSASEDKIEKAVRQNNIGEYGICIDDIGGGKFRYLIAGEYSGGEVPDGLTVYEFPKCDWAVFDCFGPLPKTLQETNTRIFKEWLPGNPEFDFFGNANIEWYGKGDTAGADYHSAIWIPVGKKE